MLPRNRAEAAFREAKAELIEANDAAHELEDQLQHAVSVRGESDRLREVALAELAASVAVVAGLTGELAGRTGERDELQSSVETLTRELAGVREQLQAETRRADEVSARADRDRVAGEKSLAQLEVRLSDSVSRVLGWSVSSTRAGTSSIPRTPPRPGWRRSWPRRPSGLMRLTREPTARMPTGPRPTGTGSPRKRARPVSRRNSSRPTPGSRNSPPTVTGSPPA